MKNKLKMDGQTDEKTDKRWMDRQMENRQKMDRQTDEKTDKIWMDRQMEKLTESQL